MNYQQISYPIDLKSVSILDSFWCAYQKRVIEKVIPYQWEAINDRVPGAEKSYCMANFRIAARLEEGEFQGMVFQDSDFAKWIEAVGYALALRPDPELEKLADEAIDLVVSAQQKDGYLDTYYIINGLNKRFTNLKDNHELYCFGHLLEGAISYYQTTGKNKLLNAMILFTECVNDNFGYQEGKLKGYPGHEVAEMALMRLYTITKDEKHLNLARYFVNQRGQQPLYFQEENKKHGNRFHWLDSSFLYQYYQAGKPVLEQKDAEGHAVRAVYLYSGMADVARVTGDMELYKATLNLWGSIVHRRMYITGGIGSTAYGESFTFDYDLPNDTIYAETCASIGLVFLARRMLQIKAKSEYADVMERALYNGIISGMSLDGTSFFYVNPLEVLPEASEKDQNRRHVRSTRQKWFGCACCPPNLARLLTSLGSYAYTVSNDTLYLHLYLGSSLKINLNGKPFEAEVQSNLPWNGDVSIIVKKGCEGIMALRIPAWCESFTLTLNGEGLKPEPVDGYMLLKRNWEAGDSLQIHFDMRVTVIAANPRIRENIGKVAVTRGPLVYCLEQEDNGLDLHLLRLNIDAVFNEEYCQDVLEGVMILKTDGVKLLNDWDAKTLYRPVIAELTEPRTLTFIPYYAWANRSQGEMLVWVQKK